MRIALEAMGGDHAPERPVDGALAALGRPERDFEVVSVGDEPWLSPLLPRGAGVERLTIRDAPEVIGGDR